MAFSFRIRRPICLTNLQFHLFISPASLALFRLQERRLWFRPRVTLPLLFILVLKNHLQHNEEGSSFLSAYLVLHKPDYISGPLSPTRTYLYESLSYYQPKHLSKTWRIPFRSYGEEIAPNMMNKNLLYIDSDVYE